MSIDPSFKSMFEEANLGPIRAKNRIIMAPCGTVYRFPGGAVSEQEIEYYARRTKGEVWC